VGSWIKGDTIGTDPTSGNCGGVVLRCYSDLQSLATFRTRAGITMDNVLPYLTGGLAVGSLRGEDGDIAANGSAPARPRWSGGPPVSA
jgi:hypothetical protein